MARRIRHAVLAAAVVGPTLATPAPGDDAAGTTPALVTSTAEPSYGTIARLVDAWRPPYPSEARRRGQEGWVQLSFAIRPDGTVANPIVEDSSGVAALERAAIAAILRSRYEPATWQGEPIEQCAGHMTYLFSIVRPQVGARPSFVRSWKAAVQLASERRYAEATAMLDEMERKGAWLNYEIARLWLLRASIQAATGDQAGQLRSLQRATVRRGIDLDGKLYREALLQRFALEAQLGEYGAVLSTHEEMKALEPPVADPRIEQVIADLDRAIHSRDPLGFPGVVGFRSGCAEGRPNWQHELLRRTFTFADIVGEVEEFELRCDWKRMIDQVSSGKTWQVPASWGWCQIFVFGEEGAKVKLIELPLAAGETGARPPRVLLD